jgi:hypothetical protein
LRGLRRLRLDHLPAGHRLAGRDAVSGWDVDFTGWKAELGATRRQEGDVLPITTAKPPRRPGIARVFVVLSVSAMAMLALVPMTGRADTPPSFSTVYVDGASGGGEGFVIYSHAGKDLVYSAHEGTTLTKSGNAPGGTNCDINPGGAPNGYLCSYDNQVNIWYSHDAGLTWTKSMGNPTATGFSDPSLSEDECVATATPGQVNCNIYDTGIDLVNDAMYASPDGGQTWVAGIAQCHDGDRPWLAGGKYGEGFLASNTEEAGHSIYHATVTQAGGTNVALTCSTTGIGDPGGVGQIYYNHHNGELIEPKLNSGHLGIGVLPNASAFTGSFLDRASTGPATGGIFAHWPAIAISTDATPAHPAGTIYAVWDTNVRSSALPHNGCSGSTGSAIGGNSLLQNAVKLTYSQDDGLTWSTPITIADSGGTVQWPWIAAGANGNVSVVWYQGNQVSDPDCDSANLVCQAQTPSTTCPTQWSMRVANIYGLTSGGTPTTYIVNPIQDFDTKHANGTFHVGGVCEGGTTCVATGEDRRIGDFFTNALDQNGCVMIASGDTQQLAPFTGQQLPNSLPLFVHQTSGASLTTGLPCSAPASNTPVAPWVPALLGAGGLGIGVVALSRRRRQSAASGL